MRDVRAIVTERGAGCDGRLLRQAGLFLPDENAAAYGEVVWSWRRDPGVKPAGDPPATVARKAAHRGEHEVSRKTIARGKPGCLGCTCSLTRVLFCSTLRTRDCGRSRRPAFPAPSLQGEGTTDATTRAKTCRGNASAYSHRCLKFESDASTVIARSEATTLLRLLRKLRRAQVRRSASARRRKQSISLQAEKWIASRCLSSGALSRDPFARNDADKPPLLTTPRETSAASGTSRWSFPPAPCR